MVVLTAAVCTRSGKPVIARQFVEMTRLRVEALLSAFPKLVSPTKQHTYVENESVRYLFQPLEALYLVLVTTKNSNVVEDLDTLRLLAKVLTDAVPAPTEEAVIEGAFGLVAAFDEVISLGYRESITLQGVRTNLEMNSHEEKLSIMIRMSKQQDAEKEARRKASQLAKKEPPLVPMGAGGGGSAGGFSAATVPRPSPPPSSAPASGSASGSAAGSAPGAGKAAPKKGIQLSRKNKGDNMLEAMAAEDGIDSDALLEATATTAAAAPGAVAVPKEPVTVTVAETVSCAIKQDGTLSSYEVSGLLSVVCRGEDMKCAVQLAREDERAERFTFKTHPQCDKAAWDSSAVLALKQRDRPFPANAAFGALKYHSKPVSDVSEIPLSVTVWPELAPGGKAATVNVEYELQDLALELYNVTIVVPLGSQAEPQVVNIEAGMHRHNSRKQQLEWVIEVVSAATARTGTLEFNLPAAGSGKASTDGFFPTAVAFTANKSLAGISVARVNVEGQPEARFGVETDVKTDSYEVVAEE